MKKIVTTPFIGLTVLIAVIGLACSAALPLGAKPTPTFTPTATDTPLPTDTPTPTATLDMAATRAVQATETAEQRIADVRTQLEEINLPLDTGSIVYYQREPVALKLHDFNEARYYPFLDTQTVADYILKTDVTWSTTGLVSCGLIMRSDANFKVGKQYLFVFMRLSGFPAWDLEFFNFGQFQNSIPASPKASKAINIDNDATNEFIIIAKGNKFDFYINKAYIGKYYDYSKQATKGYMAFLASQDTGTSSCTFDHTWVWELK